MSTYDRYSPRSPWIGHLWPWLLLLVLGAVLAWKFLPTLHRSGVDANATPRPITPRGDLTDEEKTTIAIFREVSPSVVHITTLNVRQDAVTQDLFQIPR